LAFGNGPKGFWAEQERVSKLKNKKPVLTCISESIPWEAFRQLLEKGYSQERNSNAGRKRIDPLILFKMLVLQQLFNLSDEEVEYQVNDRRSFEEFVGLGVMNDIPDATTVAFFRERLQQRDLDERWVKKNDINHYGYKNSICIDAEHGFIRRFVVTPANIHDSQMLPMLLDPENHNDYVWADSVYSGKRFTDLLSLAGFENRIHEKGSRNHPPSAAATERNSIKSQTRAGVEHVFGYFATSMGGKFTRKIGLKRKAWCSLKNLTFNFLRYL